MRLTFHVFLSINAKHLFIWIRLMIKYKSLKLNQWLDSKPMCVRKSEKLQRICVNKIFSQCFWLQIEFKSSFRCKDPFFAHECLYSKGLVFPNKYSVWWFIHLNSKDRFTFMGREKNWHSYNAQTLSTHFQIEIAIFPKLEVN